MISVVVLTKNEEKNIELCLASLSWCDEIVIVDDYSEDETIERIKNLEFRIKNLKGKLKIFKRHLEGDFAGQRNFGLEKANSDWVLFVDADEVVIEELQKEIISICHPELISGSNGMLKQVQHDTIGYYLKRQDYFLGKWLKYGETSKVKLLRLAKKNAGVWQGRVHEIWGIDGRVNELENSLLHYPHQTITEFLKEINWYTDLVAQYWREQGRKVSFLEIVLYPTGKFVQNYLLRLGFLDGVPGLIMALMMSFHSFLARGKLWLEKHK